MFKRLVFCFIISCLIPFSITSQTPVLDQNGNETGLINVNPDPNGEQWIAGGVSKEAWDKFVAGVPSLKLEGAEKRAPAPEKADNTVSTAFRPIFNQSGGSCAQASSIGYVFTYEINTLRSLAANVKQNQYPYDYTYNFVNSGSGSNGSMPSQGFEMAVYTGIPNAEVYGGFGLGDHDRWVSGYNVYYNGMANRAASQFTIKVNTEEGMKTMREWLHNHGTGASNGGCLVFCYNSSSCQTVSLASGTPEAGKKALVTFGSSGGHAVSIAGYNDSVRYDYNGDGKYTNDVDLDGDRAITVADWEVGAVIMVNSWGTSFGNSGKIYVMYRLCAITGGMWSQTVYGMKTGEQVVKPKLAIKAKIDHGTRNLIRVRAGMSNNTSATTPATSDIISFGKAFNYAGGAYPMCGGGASSELELGLDVTSLFNKMTAKQAKFFLCVDSKGGTGKVVSFSLMDYASGSAVEIPCSQQNVTITPGTSSTAQTTYVSIIYNNSTPVNTSVKNPVSAYDLNYCNSRIHFKVPDNISGKKEAVRIALFNAQGKMVKSIINNSFNAGYYSAPVNNLATGLYFCRMEAAGFSKGINIIVTK